MSDLTLRELLTTYWPQAVAFASLAAFFVNRIFDLRVKRIENKQGLFQEHRIRVILDFVSAYNNLQVHYRRMFLVDFDSANVNKKLLIDQTEDMYSQYFYLRFFLDPLEMVRYSDLMTAMNQLSKDMTSQEGGDIKLEVLNTLNINNENLKVITEMFRRNSMKHSAIGLKA